MKELENRVFKCPHCASTKGDYYMMSDRLDVENFCLSCYKTIDNRHEHFIENQTSLQEYESLLESNLFIFLEICYNYYKIKTGLTLGKFGKREVNKILTRQLNQINVTV